MIHETSIGGGEREITQFVEKELIAGPPERLNQGLHGGLKFRERRPANSSNRSYRSLVDAIAFDVEGQQQFDQISSSTELAGDFTKHFLQAFEGRPGQFLPFRNQLQPLRTALGCDRS